MNTFEFAKEMGMKLYNGNEFLLKVELMEECPDGYKEIALVDDFGFPLSLCTNGDDIVAYIDFPDDFDEEDDDDFEIEDKNEEDNNMEIGYVLKEKLSCGCWDGCFDYFFRRLRTEPTERLRILAAINEFMYQGDELIKKYICLDTEIDNVDSLDEVHLMNEVIDSMNYKQVYVAMLDEYGNPSLYDIELRLVSSTTKFDELKLDIEVETDEYVYGNSDYYGSRIIINKLTRKIYEIAPCHDVCVCLIDIAQTYDNLDEFGYMMPFYITNIEAFDTEGLCDDLYSEILSWEKDSKVYLLNHLNYRKEN